MRSCRFVFADLSNPRRLVVVKVERHDGRCDDCEGCFHLFFQCRAAGVLRYVDAVLLI